MRPGVETLTELPILRGFRESEIRDLNELGDLARVGPGEVLYREGERLDALHVLVDGYVAETTSNSKETPITDVIAPVTPIDLPSIILDIPTASATMTITSTRIVLLPAEPLRSMLSAHAELANSVLSQSLREMRAQRAEVANLKLLSSVQRLAGFILSCVTDPDQSPARIILPYEKRFLAAKIGCSQENLSRAFAALRPFGVYSERGVVIVRDLDVLKAYQRKRSRIPA